jgi:hypothetical protein
MDRRCHGEAMWSLAEWLSPSVATNPTRIATACNHEHRSSHGLFGGTTANPKAARCQQTTQSTGLASVIDTPSRATAQCRHQLNPAAPAGPLRLGCDPLHCHLLVEEPPGLLAWDPLSRWVELLREGAIDAALVSVAGMAADEMGAVTETTGGHRSGSGPWLDRASCGHAVTLLPLGSRPLVLIHAPAGPGARDQSPRPWQLLLPPADHQPQLWRELQRLDLLPLRDCSADDCESWLQALLQGPHLLPAHLSLLEEPPWREAGLKAVPPPEPLEESLWLLVREGEEGLPAIEALIERLQDRLLESSRGMQPMD